MDLSLGTEISLEGAPKATQSMSKQYSASTNILTMCAAQLPRMQLFRAIDGPSLPANLIACRPELRPPLFYYDLELGSSFAVFEEYGAACPCSKAQRLALLARVLGLPHCYLLHPALSRETVNTVFVMAYRRAVAQSGQVDL
jgi:hypothetical protein